MGPKDLVAYQKALKWPPMERPDHDKFLLDVMDGLDLDDDPLAGTLSYLVRKEVPGAARQAPGSKAG